MTWSISFTVPDHPLGTDAELIKAIAHHKLPPMPDDFMPEMKTFVNPPTGNLLRASFHRADQNGHYPGDNGYGVHIGYLLEKAGKPVIDITDGDRGLRAYAWLVGSALEIQMHAQRLCYILNNVDWGIKHTEDHSACRGATYLTNEAGEAWRTDRQFKIEGHREVEPGQFERIEP